MDPRRLGGSGAAGQGRAGEPGRCQTGDVGHVSLATGSVPAAHGMVGNVWFDREAGRLVYNIEDPDHHLLSAGADVDQDREIDPTQKAAKVDGRSPAAILSSAFSDELAVHYGGKSKIFGVSV